MFLIFSHNGENLLLFKHKYYGTYDIHYIKNYLNIEEEQFSDLIGQFGCIKKKERTPMVYDKTSMVQEIEYVLLDEEKKQHCVDVLNSYIVLEKLIR